MGAAPLPRDAPAPPGCWYFYHTYDILALNRDQREADRQPMRRYTVLLLIALMALAGCTRPPAAAGRPFTVAAAADLQFAFTEIGQQFEARTGQKVVFTFGSTGNLARQIENGAPIDLFAAANLTFLDNLRARGLIIPATQQLYAVGRIVLAVNQAAGVTATALADLQDPRIKKVALANPEHAPYGQAARAALVSAGLWDPLQPKLVYAENIREALQFVQTGNAEVGILALSVAVGVPGITYTLIDDRLHPPLQQALAVIRGSPHEQVARSFAAFVLGEGQPIMRKYGFQPPGR